MKKIILITILLVLIFPTLCFAEDDLKSIEEQLQNVNPEQLQDGQVIDLRENKEQPNWFTKYLPDILIIIGAVGVIEAVLWTVRKKKIKNEE